MCLDYFQSVVVECPDLLLMFSLFVTDKEFLCCVLDIFKPGARRPRPAHAWFLKIDPVRIVCMRVCVCVSAPEAINN